MTRPEDIANRAYYAANMPTRRFRVEMDVDVEWREDEPDYAEGVIRTDLPVQAETIRMRNITVEAVHVAPKHELPETIQRHIEEGERDAKRDGLVSLQAGWLDGYGEALRRVDALAASTPAAVSDEVKAALWSTEDARNLRRSAP